MQYEILKDFPGSQDGRFCEQFKAGTTVELSDYLASIVVPEGWAKVAATAPDKISKRQTKAERAAAERLIRIDEINVEIAQTETALTAPGDKDVVALQAQLTALRDELAAL